MTGSKEKCLMMKMLEEAKKKSPKNIQYKQKDFHNEENFEQTRSGKGNQAPHNSPITYNKLNCTPIMSWGDSRTAETNIPEK